MNYDNFQIEYAITRYIHSEKYRTILRMKMIDGLSYKAIADATGYSERHIGTIVRRERALLTERLEAECGE